MRGSRIALALALVCTAAALTGCGVSKTIDPVAAAATKTADAGGAKLTMSVDVSAPSAGKSFTVTAQGEFDQGQADLTMDLGSALQGSGLSLPAGSSSLELRYLTENGDPVLYLNMPLLSQFVPGGKGWLKLDLQQAGKALGVDVTQLLSQANQNPADVLQMLQAAGSVSKVGSETIDGVATTHYTASVDVQKLADQAGPTLKALAQHMSDAGVTAIPLDVWIGDDDGLVHRLTVNEQVGAQGQSASVALTLNISDYGTAVDVQAPPADQVTDVTGLAAMAAASGGTTH